MSFAAATAAAAAPVVIAGAAPAVPVPAGTSSDWFRVCSCYSCCCS